MRYDWETQIEKIYPPVTSQAIGAIEREMGVSLPEDYRSFLLVANGGIFFGSPQFRYWTSASDGSRNVEVAHLRIICGLDPRNEDLEIRSLRCSQEWYGFNEEVPPKYVAIGHPHHHAVICISTAGDDAGAVYIWEPAELGVPGDFPEEYLYRIAGSFHEFLESLESRQE